MTHSFKTLDLLPADPILGLSVLFQKDPRAQKVNLGIGAYKSEDGKVTLFESVYQAERMLWEEKRSKGYAPIDGDQTYQQEVLKLIFGQKVDLKTHYAAQTVGCTAALRVSGQLLKTLGYETIFIPEQTWQNHFLIYQSSGLKTEKYPYYDTQTCTLKIDELIKTLENAPENSAVLLQVSCHNPVGRDPTQEQWKKIAEVIENKNLFVVLDSAYQGFGQGLEEDMYPVKLFEEKLERFFLCYSFSKNFGLYGERTGALIAFDSSGQYLEQVASHIRRSIRSFYSSPAIHGARIVKAILQSEDLKSIWESELYDMQKRLKFLRKEFVSILKSHQITRDYNYIIEDQGLFSLMGLSEQQVDELKDQFGIYMVRNGRINIAGLSSKNMDYVASSIKAVLK